MNAVNLDALTPRNHRVSDVLITVLAAVGAGGILHSVYQTWKKSGLDSGNIIIKSPLETTLPELSEKEVSRLPYPPDVIPGGRDIDTPYGKIRAYEWGPEEGKKVLLVHGISTPCVALFGVAEGLVRSGCRVILFDLFGRGYSSGPDPNRCPQDIRLFTSQILLVLSSSTVAWTNFTLIGYSLGGGIAAAFTSYFPNLVDSLILIAPSGLLRPAHIHWTSKLIYSGLLPQWLLHHLVRRRLGGGSSPPQPKLASEKPDDTQIGITDAESAETPSPSHPALAPNSPLSLSLSARRPSVSIADAVSWQLANHDGFLPSFISSIQHAPITGQDERWRVIGSRLAAQRTDPSNQDLQRQGLREGKVLLLLGRSDSVIVADEVSEDARRVLGTEGMDVRILEGGHEVPISHSDDVVREIVEFWTR